MTENQQDQPQKETPKEESPWSSIIIGVVIIACAFLLYYTFDNMEKEGSSMRLNWIIALAYKIGGKWTVAVILAIIGFFITYSGVSEIIKKKQN